MTDMQTAYIKLHEEHRKKKKVLSPSDAFKAGAEWQREDVIHKIYENTVYIKKVAKKKDIFKGYINEPLMSEEEQQILDND